MMTAEQHLYRAIIRQAFMDACGRKKPPGVDVRDWDNVRNRAQAWFKRNSQDYRDVCYMADVDPDALRTKAVQLIEAGIQVELLPSRSGDAFGFYVDGRRTA